MCSLDIPAGQAKLLGEPGMLQIPQAQGGPQASVPSSRLSHDGILSPTPNTRELALDVGWAAYLKPPFTLILELILPLIGPLNHIPGKGIFSLWAAYLLNADKENFGTTVTLFQHPKSISMLGLFVLGIRHRKIPEWDKHRTGNIFNVKNLKCTVLGLLTFCAYRGQQMAGSSKGHSCCGDQGNDQVACNTLLTNIHVLGTGLSTLCRIFNAIINIAWKREGYY